MCMHEYYCQTDYFNAYPSNKHWLVVENIVDFHMKFDITNGINRLNIYLLGLNEVRYVDNDGDVDTRPVKNETKSEQRMLIHK